MFKRPTKAAVAEAEAISDELALLTAPIEACAWEIDSALSSLRKDAAGYTPGELETAVARGRQLLAYAQALKELQARWDRQDAADAARRTGLQGNLAFRPCASRA